MTALPEISDNGLTAIHQVKGVDYCGTGRQVPIVDERPLTVRVDGQVLVTLMTLGTHPEKLVLGYLRNQALFESLSQIKSVQVDWLAQCADVITHSGQGLSTLDITRRTVTTGCGQGTVLSCTLDKLYDHRVERKPLKQSTIYQALKAVSRYNQTYRKAGSVHGCGLCRGVRVLSFIEDVGRHNAMDAISGDMWLNRVSGSDKVLYTTGRLTSEIVMKAALMAIPVLISRNGTTHMALELAQDLGVTLVTRAKSRQFVALNADNIVFDQRPGTDYG